MTVDAGAGVLAPFHGARLVRAGASVETWRARANGDGAEVLVRVLSAPTARDPRVASEFLARANQGREARGAHLHVARGVGVLPDGRPFAELETPPGVPLAEELSRIRALPWREVAAIGAQLAEALAELHGRHLLHLELTVANVNVVREGPLPRGVLIDGGVPPPEIDVERPIAAVGSIFPELVDGGPIDARSDLYALGALLYECLAGRPPFRAQSVPDVALAHAHVPLPPLRAPAGLEPLPEALVAVVGRCLRKAPADRWANAAQLRDALLGVIAASPTGARISRTSFAVELPQPLQAERQPLAQTQALEGPALAGRPLPQLGESLGVYRLIAVLGEGGMGRVYLAEHARLGRRVALKLLRPELASNPVTVRRFFGEARAVNQVAHENIVEVTDFVEDGATCFCVMELLTGQSLRARLDEGPLPVESCVRIGAQIASALAAVHAAGIVHRDLKPENVFLADRPGRTEFVKVLDFGVAKLAGRTDGVGTRDGAILGTPEYMSPEQIGGEATDARTDTYSLGAILFEMITGQLPFRGGNFGDLVVAHRTQPAPRPSAHAGILQPVPAPYEQLVLACLAKLPAERPASMDEVEASLARLARELRDGNVRLAEPAAPAAGPARARPGPVLAVVAVLLLLAAGWLGWRIFGPPLAPIERTPLPPGAASPAVTAAPAPPLAPPAQISVTIVSTPSGAKVFRAGEEAALGETPLTLRLDRRDEVEQFELRAEGYDAASTSVPLTADATLSVALARLAEAAKTKPAPLPAPPPPVAPRPVDPALDRGAVVDPFEE